MSINFKDKDRIEFQDLIEDICNRICTNCSNVDNYNPGANDLRYNIEVNLASGVTAKSTNSKFKSVTRSIIELQLTQFLTKRGLIQSSKQHTVISARGLLNYYNNVIIFLNARLKRYQSVVNQNKTVLIYDDSNVSYSQVQINDSIGSINQSLMNKTYEQMLQEFNSVKISHTNKLTLSFASSCSSSSSSCSSCSCSSSSSSCSSSSSSFIVYMLI